MTCAHHTPSVIGVCGTRACTLALLPVFTPPPVHARLCRSGILAGVGHYGPGTGRTGGGTPGAAAPDGRGTPLGGAGQGALALRRAGGLPGRRVGIPRRARPPGRRAPGLAAGAPP